MGTINFGNQLMSFGFGEAAKASLFNTYMSDIVPTGLYTWTNPLLTIVTNSSVRINPLTLYIQDPAANQSGTGYSIAKLSLRVQTSQTATVNNVTQGTDSGSNYGPWIVAQFRWVEASTNYMDFYALKSSLVFSDYPNNTQVNPGLIILGRAIFTGNNLTGFDYNRIMLSPLQSMTNNFSQFYVIPSGDSTNKIYVYPGMANINGVLVNFTGGESSVIASTTSGRNDLIYIGSNNSINIIYNYNGSGTLDGYPPITEYPTDGMPVALISRSGSWSTVEGQHITQINPNRYSFSGSEIDLIFKKNVVITGNLTVNGSTVSLETSNTTIKDSIITLNDGLSGAPPSSLESGIMINRGSSTPFYLIWDEGDDSLKLGVTSTPATDNTNQNILQKVATREHSPNINGIPFWNNIYSRFDTTANLIYNSSTNTLAFSGIFNLSAGVSNSALISTTTTFNKQGTSGGDVIFSWTNSTNYTNVYYRNESLETRFLVKSGNNIDAGTNNMNTDIYMNSAKQIHIYPYIDTSSSFSTTQSTLEQLFLRKKYDTLDGASPAQQIYNDIVMPTNTTLSRYPTFTYKGNELDVRYLKTFYVSSGTGYGTSTLWGNLVISNTQNGTGANTSYGNITLGNDLSVGRNAVVASKLGLNSANATDSNSSITFGATDFFGYKNDVHLYNAPVSLSASRVYWNNGIISTVPTNDGVGQWGIFSEEASPTTKYLNLIYKASSATQFNIMALTQIGDDGIGGTGLLSQTYGALGVTRSSATGNNSYISLVKTGGTAYGFGINTNNNFIIGAANSGRLINIPALFLSSTGGPSGGVGVSINSATYLGTYNFSVDGSSYTRGNHTVYGQVIANTTGVNSLFTGIQIDNSSTGPILNLGASKSLQINTQGNGYLQIGPQDTISNHFITDRVYHKVLAIGSTATGVMAVDTNSGNGGLTGYNPSNYAGIGSALYLPQGLWSNGTNAWIYGTVTFNGAVTGATSYQVGSKRSLKENIKKFEEDAISLINSIDVVEYNYIKDKEKNRRIGFIADDTDEIFSTKNHDNFDITNTLSVVVKALQKIDERLNRVEINNGL